MWGSKRRTWRLSRKHALCRAIAAAVNVTVTLASRDNEKVKEVLYLEDIKADNVFFTDGPGTCEDSRRGNTGAVFPGRCKQGHRPVLQNVDISFDFTDPAVVVDSRDKDNQYSPYSLLRRERQSSCFSGKRAGASDFSGSYSNSMWTEAASQESLP